MCVRCGFGSNGTMELPFFQARLEKKRKKKKKKNKKKNKNFPES